MNDILPQLGLNPRPIGDVQPRPQRQSIEPESNAGNNSRSGYRQKSPSPALLEQQISDALDALGQGQYLERGSIVDIVL